MYTSLLYFIGAYLLTRMLLPIFLQMLTVPAVMKDNWQGRSIPALTGLIFPVIMTIMGLIQMIINREKSIVLVNLFAVIAVSFLGFIDDILGTPDQKGLKGHLFHFLNHKKISTGLLKAVGTGVISLWIIVYKGSTGLNMVIEWLVLVLTANFINLLDLRPGRALKGTIFLVFMGMIISTQQISLGAVVLGIILAYAPFDMSGQAMLGDTGSNTLGMISGLLIIQGSQYIKIVILFSLVVIHVIAEKHSLTRIINDNYWLNRIDRWGRG